MLQNKWLWISVGAIVLFLIYTYYLYIVGIMFVIFLLYIFSPNQREDTRRAIGNAIGECVESSFDN